jgi:hypothetical protein
VPEKLGRDRASGCHRRERRKEHRLERRPDEAVGRAAALIERLGMEEAPPALEEDCRIAALVESVRGVEDRE